MFMPRVQYQPVNNKQYSSAQEVIYNKAFKRADIASGFRHDRIKQARREA